MSLGKGSHAINDKQPHYGSVLGTCTYVHGYGRLVPTVDPRAPIASEAVANPATGTAQVWLQNR